MFGILQLSGFVAATAFSVVGHTLSSRNMAFLGSFTQGVAVLLFGMLEFSEDKVVFLSFSYLLRKEICYTIVLEINVLVSLN